MKAHWAQAASRAAAHIRELEITRTWLHQVLCDTSVGRVPRSAFAALRKTLRVSQQRDEPGTPVPYSPLACDESTDSSDDSGVNDDDNGELDSGEGECMHVYVHVCVCACGVHILVIVY
jgi:hypothetical protein